MTRTSTYDALQWVKSLLNKGITKFCLMDLPENLQQKKYLLKAKSKNLIYEVGNIRHPAGGTLVKVWQIHPDVETIISVTNIKLRDINGVC